MAFNSSIKFQNLLESYEESGPFGVKSIAEIGINGALPALAIAIYAVIAV